MICTRPTVLTLAWASGRTLMFNPKNEYGIAVLANFSCGISVILILTYGIEVFSKPVGCVVFVFRSAIVGIKNINFPFSRPFLAVFGRFGSYNNLFCHAL